MRSFHLLPALLLIAGCAHGRAPGAPPKPSAAAPVASARIAKNQAATVNLFFTVKEKDKDGKVLEGKIPATGVVIGPRRILTSPAVLAMAAESVVIKGIKEDGTGFVAQAKGRRSNPDLNIAVLETVDPLPVEPVVWDVALPVEGDAIYTVDFFGAAYSQAAHFGRVSFWVKSEEHIDFFIFDATVSMSSCGAGVFNAQGRMIGLVVGVPTGGNIAPFGQALAASEIAGFLKAQEGAGK